MNKPKTMQEMITWLREHGTREHGGKFANMDEVSEHLEFSTSLANKIKYGHEPSKVVQKVIASEFNAQWEKQNG